MKPKIPPFLLLAAALVFLPQLSHSEVAPSLSERFGFPIQSGMVELCSGNVLGTDGSEIVWSIFTSTQSPSRLVKGYQDKLDAEGFSQTATGGIWRSSGTSSERILEISPASAFHSKTSCPKKITRGTNSIVETSVMMKKSVPKSSWTCPKGQHPIRGKYATIHNLDTYYCCPDGAICD